MSPRAAEVVKIPDQYRDLLDKKGFAHVATIGPDGAPQSNPVWYDFDGENLMFSQTKTRQKYHNVNRDPHVALSITDPDDPYRYLEIRGRVVEITEDEENRFIDSMAQKYMDEEEYPYHQPRDERVIVRVAPERTTSMG